MKHSKGLLTGELVRVLPVDLFDNKTIFIGPTEYNKIKVFEAREQGIDFKDCFELGLKVTKGEFKDQVYLIRFTQIDEVLKRLDREYRFIVIMDTIPMGSSGSKVDERLPRARVIPN